MQTKISPRICQPLEGSGETQPGSFSGFAQVVASEAANSNWVPRHHQFSQLTDNLLVDPLIPGWVTSSA